MNSARAIIFVFTCFTALLSCAHTQAIPPDLKTWTLEYPVDGGMTSFHRGLTVAESGDLTGNR
ncbi:MAG TPA: hypothetical protein VFA89_18885 [Terriglobales bacterium]|nr:hypothetical protein [Terriglobales bacterium]